MIRPLRVLHVEDDNDIHQILRTVAGQTINFMQVTTLADARSAIRLEPFDVIILDVKLPDGVGMELMKDISQLQANARVIVFSGDEAASENVLGVEAVLLKSLVSMDDVIKSIKSQIIPTNKDVSL